MTDAEKLKMLRAMVGNPSGNDNDWSDDVLLTFLSLAGQKIIRRVYPYSSEGKSVPEKYCTLQCEIAQYMLNKRGAEGQTSHSENGISRSYENGDIPESMLSDIIPFCGVI